MEQKTRKGLEMVPRQKPRNDDDGKPEFTTEAVRKLIAEALPERELAIKRDALVNAIVERIETWRATKPQIEPHADKVRQLVAIADRLNSAVEAAGAALLKLGVDKEIEKAKAERVGMGIDLDKVPLGGHSVTIDLYLIPCRASDGLRKWNRIHRPAKHRHKEFGAALTADLQLLCRKIAGCSAKEFGDFLQPLNDSVEWDQAGLPKLVPATLKKRRERERRKRGTN
jgi:hypothetical protein